MLYLCYMLTAIDRMCWEVWKYLYMCVCALLCACICVCAFMCVLLHTCACMVIKSYQDTHPLVLVGRLLVLTCLQFLITISIDAVSTVLIPLQCMCVYVHACVCARMCMCGDQVVLMVTCWLWWADSLFLPAYSSSQSRYQCCTYCSPTGTVCMYRTLYSSGGHNCHHNY